MPLIRNRAIVTNDPFCFVRDTDTLPEQGDIVVTLPRLIAEKATLARREGRLGVTLEPTDDLKELVPHLAELSLIAVHFPKFGDGRGYSHARLLRERHGYRGELRAVGEVLADQLFYMQRCGMDSFYLVDGKDVAAAIACLDDFSVTYQAAVDEPRPLYRRVARGHVRAR